MASNSSPAPLLPASTQFIFRLWNLETGQETVLDQIENPGLWPCNLCLSDDGKRLGMSLAAAESTPEVRIVDLESGSVLLKIPCAHAQEGNAAMTRLSPDGKLAMTTTLWNQAPPGSLAVWAASHRRLGRRESASAD